MHGRNMLEIQLLSSIPHANEDILSKRPIRADLNGILVEFPLLSYKQYNDFNKAVKLLGAQALAGIDIKDVEQFKHGLMVIYGAYPELKLYEGMELPKLVISMLSIVNKADAIDILNKWGQANGKEQLRSESTEEEIRQALLHYFVNIYSIDHCYWFFMLLIYLNENVKKKAVKLLVAGHKGSTSQTLRPLSVTRQAAAFYRNKHLQENRTQ